VQGALELIRADGNDCRPADAVRNLQPQNVIAISRADVILVTFNDDSSARKTRGSTSGRLRLKQPAMHGSEHFRESQESPRRDNP
jgi:hypothetical protein